MVQLPRLSGASGSRASGSMVAGRSGRPATIAADLHAAAPRPRAVRRGPTAAVDFLGMNQIEPTRSRPPVMKRVVAGLVLIVVAALALHFIVSLVLAVFWVVVVIAAIVAVIWALNTIL